MTAFCGDAMATCIHENIGDKSYAFMINYLASLGFPLQYNLPKSNSFTAAGVHKHQRQVTDMGTQSLWDLKVVDPLTDEERAQLKPAETIHIDSAGRVSPGYISYNRCGPPSRLPNICHGGSQGRELTAPLGLSLWVGS
mmetsp:Transcript_12167/g.38533  ORF Transcript_12167/g.38533 Transcript_12167/m.38533 type:complete len:139 (-) Transcript_12167:46-462(-)